MKRFKWIFTIAVVLALFAAFPAQAAIQDMSAEVYRWTGAMNGDGTMALSRITSGITFKVLAHGSDTAETTYYPASASGKALTSLTNPVTTTSYASATICNDRVAFRVDPTDATDDRYVDLIVVDTTGGYTLFYPHFDKYTHSLVIDERPNVMHHGMIWFSCLSDVQTAGGEYATGITFVPDTFVHDVWVEVVTVDSGVYMDVGTSDDTDGYRDNVLLTTASYVKDTGVVTSGTSADYTAVSTYGALLVTAITGSGTITGLNVEVGGKSYIGHIVTTAGTNDDLTYSGVSGNDTGAGYLHYWFTRLR
jgi:hypothetical protein